MSEQTGLYEGDIIMLTGQWGAEYVCTVVMFRDCLGVFLEPQHKTMQDFTPLCALYERGPDSKSQYMPNFGEYYTNPVAAWMQLRGPKPTDTPHQTPR
jgi:hypothetical protein